MEAAGLPDVAWKAPHRLVTGAACGVRPQEASAVSVGLDLSLELLVGFSGGPEPLKSTEVQQCGLAEFHLVFSRIFILEFDPVCLPMGWE